MTNEDGTPDFSQVMQILSKATELWPKMLPKIKTAWTQSQKGLGEGDIWEVDRLLSEFQDKIMLVAQKAHQEGERRPKEWFYQWLEDALLFQVRRPYHKIFTPEWYMDSADRGLEALKDSLSSAALSALSAGERQRLIERLEKAGGTVKEILTKLKNPPTEQRGRKKS